MQLPPCKHENENHQENPRSSASFRLSQLRQGISSEPPTRRRGFTIRRRNTNIWPWR
jgi:hypothetical protein